MNSPTAAPLLADEHLALLSLGVSAIVGSTSLGLVPSVMRAVGFALAPGGRSITVFLGRQQSVQLLRDVAASGRMSVVFSQPSSHRTLQIKTRRLRLREANEADLPALQRYLGLMEAELATIGFSFAYVRAMLAFRLDDTVAIEFEPDEAFDQTPGPKAGQPIVGRA